MFELPSLAQLRVSDPSFFPPGPSIDTLQVAHHRASIVRPVLIGVVQHLVDEVQSSPVQNLEDIQILLAR